MIIIAGLGNPGPRYEKNRHNIGFMAADEIARRWRFGPERAKFQSIVSEGEVEGTKVLLMKPQTYMNESGRAVGEAMRFYKLSPSDIVVFHDELDLPPAKLRLKTGGGAGGHNGLRSIIQHIGEAFRRVRLGIGHPGRKELVHAYVLHDFAKADEDWLIPLLDAIAEQAPLIGQGKDQTFANKAHLALNPEQAAQKKPQPTSATPDSQTPTDAASEAKPDEGPFAALKRLIDK